VVVLHWLSVMPHLQGATVRDVNVVDVMPGLWPLTWMGDVMALFFFAGGYANWTSLRAPSSAGRPAATSSYAASDGCCCRRSVSSHSGWEST
jgi:hypothetical protein